MKSKKKRNRLDVVLITIVLSLILILGIVQAINLANPIGESFLRPQSCSAENLASKGTFTGSCNGTYPSVCGADGDLLSCDDGFVESHLFSVNDYAGIQINISNNSVQYCNLIQNVFLCYEWWTDNSQISDCDLSVDNDAGSSYNAVITTCPGTSANPGITCANITSLEDWVCSDFFGASTSGVLIKSEAKKLGAPTIQNLSWDVLFFNVSYTELEIISPLENLYTNNQPLDFNISFADSGSSITIYYYINGILNQTSKTNTTFNASVGEYILNVSLFDGFSYSSNETINFAIDTAKPNIILDKPENNLVNDSYQYVNITFNGTITDNLGIKNATLYHNASGMWKENLSIDLSGLDTEFEFSLILSDVNYIWNIKACDLAGNCDFSSANRTVNLNFTPPAEYLDVTNFTPENNSINVSLEADIIAFFDKDIDRFSLTDQTIIITDSSNKTVRGVPIYVPPFKKLTFKLFRFLKENETYFVNLTTGIKSDDNLSFSSDILWSFTTELKDTDNDGIPDVDDEDDDNDNINDSNDFLKGNASNIQTDIENLTIKVNQSQNLSKRFIKSELVQFFNNGSINIEFNFSFDSNTLDLTNISIQQNENSSKGSLIINSLKINTTKVFYIDNLSVHQGICIKDFDVDGLEDISSSCNETYETFVKCPGSQGSYDCIINGSRFKLTGLNHSAVEQSDDVIAPRVDLISVSSSGSSTVEVSLTVVTNEDSTCKFDASDVSFGSMSFSMSGSGTLHTGSRSYSTDTSGTYHILCKDDFENLMSSSSSVSFSADVSEDSSGNGGSSGGRGFSSRGITSNVSSCNENWVCDSWSGCTNNFQTRNCIDINKCDSKSYKPIEFQTCKNGCEELWQCESWSVCSENITNRQCYDLRNCGSEELKPSEFESCEFIPNCYNSVLDKGETSTDCGGVCQPCETCFDRIQNQDESGIDCGGSCRKCRVGDIIAGRSILVFPEHTPSIFFPVIILIIMGISLLNIFKPDLFKNLSLKKKVKSQDKKNIISDLVNQYKLGNNKNKMYPNFDKKFLSGTKPLKSQKFKAKSFDVDNLNNKEKILNKLNEVYKHGK